MEKKRSSRRISSLFSLGGSDSGAGSAGSSESSSRLTKVKNRISSATHLTPEYPPPPPPKQHGNTLQPTIHPVESAPAALDPPPPISSAANSRSSSPARPASTTRSGSRPGSQTTSRPGTRDGLRDNYGGAGLQVPATGETKLRKLKRRSGLFGGAQTSDEGVHETSGRGPVKGHANIPGGPLAWIIGHSGQVPYNLTMLLNGEKVDELWDDQGDTLVYLFPRTSGKGPSFRIDSSLYADSLYMTKLVHGSLYSEPAHGTNHDVEAPERSETFPSIRTESPEPVVNGSSSDGSKGSRALSDATEDDHSEKHLYLPIQLSTDQAAITPSAQEPRLSTKDIDTLITYRNFIAFLMGQSLVATERHHGIFEIFLRISDILNHYQFSNVDGSTYGEIASSSFDSYVDELALADVRSSREKTIEAIVLGEHMRSMVLYTEGFVHAAGKLDSIKELNHPKYEMISPKTSTRLARAAMDLEMRTKNIDTKLTDFDFPAIFSGLMNSDTADEKKLIRFKNWRASFMSCRSFAIDYYKSKYGSWLPKAKSKKNNLTTSGLNRLVLLEIYRDLSTLYDLLADRTNLTTRTADGFTTEDEGTGFECIAYRALRKVLSEYDRSVPPVQPPIPFDLPLFPTLKGIKSDYPSNDPKKDAKARSKKLKSDEIARIMKRSHNPDAEQQTAFLEAFRAFEHKQASGSTMDELWEMRTGHWLFLYAVIQSLPMLVIDAPGVRYTQGVEYFLCEPPRSGAPWGRDDTTRARTWFGVAGGTQVVSLPTDIVQHGVEGVFRRSHCWAMAEKWSQYDVLLNAAVQESMNSAPLPPPPGGMLAANGAPRARSSSPDRRRESVMDFGLEALPVPAGPANPLVMRPASSNDPSKTFDAILQSAELQQTPPKGKKKK
ncbi:hypothetical protein BU24DRAFT_53223 [Aaosphaeria arxii CBS 175.79]|uniref:DUF8004 domain-containing protein n=1 Tax=Aaosphaeria arxii CBS 175.79 TaxID=1450172 RepID=A0A6A5XE22_9PLEO|nr:uncharacterized protein BU24DRAFT_53223 [Aaosphaeria arxii CBS 175.79]KAF2011113.1 hypothetical protein BU24DRAFT_53223 [Aaosphaeria arxii CBS 175.79]